MDRREAERLLELALNGDAGAEEQIRQALGIQDVPLPPPSYGPPLPPKRRPPPPPPTAAEQAAREAARAAEERRVQEQLQKLKTSSVDEVKKKEKELQQKAREAFAREQEALQRRIAALDQTFAPIFEEVNKIMTTPSGQVARMITDKKARILLNKVHPDKSLGDPRFGAILMRIFKDLTNKFMEAFPDSPLFKDKPWEARLAGEGKKKRCRHCGLSKK